jgi:hypothetical protein
MKKCPDCGIRYNKGRKMFSNRPFAEEIDNGVRNAIEGCGICYYKVCRQDSTKPFPKEAKLQN